MTSEHGGHHYCTELPGETSLFHRVTKSWSQLKAHNTYNRNLPQSHDIQAQEDATQTNKKSDCIYSLYSTEVQI